MKKCVECRNFMTILTNENTSVSSPYICKLSGTSVSKTHSCKDFKEKKKTDGDFFVFKCKSKV